MVVKRNPNGTFGNSTWVNLNYPGVVGWTSDDSVAGNQVVGIVIGRRRAASSRSRRRSTPTSGRPASGATTAGTGPDPAEEQCPPHHETSGDSKDSVSSGKPREGMGIPKSLSGAMVGEEPEIHRNQRRRGEHEQ